ncbi:MAG: C40 family peptidase [Alphaproteobacteria bacterium]|nr:C40 family peptidase [Alphaproteobacteria bacterium]
MVLDKRINAFRSDLAAAKLKGTVEALRFVEGEPASVAVGRASLRAEPSFTAGQDSELLYGEAVTVYERKDGWAWVQAANDDYVGYVREEHLAAPFDTHLQIAALMTPALSRPDCKAPVKDMLPMTAEVNLLTKLGDFLLIAPDTWVHRRHVAAPDEVQNDFAAVAEAFFGVPYVWGGKTFAGLDCSGLVQTALTACGIRSPRDTDMMERYFPDSGPEFERGDLVFWKGHVGIMLDGEQLLHANAHHMMVAIEPLAEAAPRIEKTAGPITAVKRPR